MSDEYDDGGPASEKTLLDWFAGQAMKALIEKIPAYEIEGRDGCECADEHTLGKIRKGVATSAYKQAVEMLAERKRRQKEMG